MSTSTFEPFDSTVIALLNNDIDTDQIIPARYLKGISREGLGAHLFHDLRHSEDGTPRPDFILNTPRAQGARILLAGQNFGCGSSREHAPWALTDWGIRAIISTTFADIFHNNALKNGLLPIQVGPKDHAALVTLVSTTPAAMLHVDLAAQHIILPNKAAIRFPIHAFAKRCMLEGIDELSYLLSLDTRIGAYEDARTR